jgi:hypothetical protein
MLIFEKEKKNRLQINLQLEYNFLNKKYIFL